MKACLTILAVVGVLWLASLAFQRFVDPVFAVDAFIPPTALAMMSAEERSRIQQHLRHLLAPGYLSWIGAWSVLILSSAALRLEMKKAPIQPPKPTSGLALGRGSS